jgi:hypothetical protein
LQALAADGDDGAVNCETAGQQHGGAEPGQEGHVDLDVGNSAEGMKAEQDIEPHARDEEHGESGEDEPEPDGRCPGWGSEAALCAGSHFISGSRALNGHGGGLQLRLIVGGIEQRQANEKRHEKQRCNQGEAVKRAVPSEVHEVHADEAALDDGDEQCDPDIGVSEIDEGDADRDGGQEDQGAVYVEKHTARDGMDAVRGIGTHIVRHGSRYVVRMGGKRNIQMRSTKCQ